MQVPVFLRWWRGVWLEDDELRKDGGGVGSAAVFVLQVALVSRRLAVTVVGG